MSDAMADDGVHDEELVLALASVDGATAACAEHGDRATLAVLSEYYAILGRATTDAGGRVVKVMGDGVLAVFPPSRIRDAMVLLRESQAEANRIWRALDGRCRVVLRVGAGRVLSGDLGPPGMQRPDVYGDALNRLFKAPHGDLVMMPEAQALLK